jgi:outer membrane receptor protein involved in Fe transport
MKKAYLAFVLCLLFAAPASAQGDDGVLDLGDVVITATKTPTQKENVTQKVDVITEQEIDKLILGNGNVAEILSWQPGVFTSVLSRNDANWGAYGSVGPKYNTFMLDGLPVDSFVDTQTLDPWIFQRVETQRGPASVLYSNYLSQDFAGNQAPLAGTTNLILRESVDAPMTRISAGYGSYNTYKGHYYHQDKSGDDLNIMVGADYEKSDYTHYGTPQSWLDMTQSPDFKKSKIYVRTAQFFGGSDRKLTLFANHADHTYSLGRPNRDHSHDYDLLNAAYQTPLGQNVTGQFKVGYRDYDRSMQEDNYNAAAAVKDYSLKETNGVKQKIIPADVSLAWNLNSNSLLTAGVDYQSADYETWGKATTGVITIRNQATAKQYGLYLQEDVARDEFVWRLGARYQHINMDIDKVDGAAPVQKSKSWNKMLWSAGMRWKPQGRAWTLFSNAGTSFMAPSLKSTGGTIPTGSVANGQFPNPALQPEKGMALDMGMDYAISETQSMGLRLFYNKVDDAIVENTISSAPGPSQSMSVNAGELKSYGLEFEYETQVWFANLTWSKSEISNPLDANQDGSEPTFVPSTVANIGGTFSLGKGWSASPYLRITGGIYDNTDKTARTRFKGYQVLNMKIQKTFSRAARDTTWSLDLYNLLDKQFVMPWNFKDPGFSFTLGAEIAM